MDINNIQKNINFQDVSEFDENYDEINSESYNELDNNKSKIEIEQNDCYIEPTINMNNQ